MKKLIITSVLTVALALTATSVGACQKTYDISSISEAKSLLMSKAGFRGYEAMTCPKCGNTARVYRNARTGKVTISCNDCSYLESFYI